MEKTREVVEMEKLEAASEAEKRGEEAVAAVAEPEDALSDLVAQYAVKPRQKRKFKPRPKPQGKTEK